MASFINIFADILIIFYLLDLALYIYVNYKNKLFDFIFCIISATSISEGLKFVFATSRPIPDLEGGGFPSTHSTVAFAAVFFFLLVCRTLSPSKREGKYKNIFDIVGKVSKSLVVGVAFTMAMFIGYLRIVSGAHYFIDVFAGLILGLLVSMPFKYYDVSVRKMK